MTKRTERQPPALEPAHDAAIEWAGALAISHSTMSLDQMQAAWNAPASIAHRELLKAKSPAIMSQLNQAMKARIDALKAAGDQP